MADEKKMGLLRVVNLDDDAVLQLIRGEPVIITNSEREMIVICNNLSKAEIEEALCNVLGDENFVVLGRKLDG